MGIITNRFSLLYVSFIALAIAIVGCGPSAIPRASTNSPVKGLLVQVQELDASKAIVRDYSDPVQPYGLQTSQAIVEALQEAGINAELATTDTPLRGQVMVEGRITLIEGGDTTTRVLVQRLRARRCSAFWGGGPGTASGWNVARRIYCRTFSVGGHMVAER